MLKKLLLLAGAIIVVGGIAGGALYYFYPVPVSVTAGLVRNFVLSYSAPPGTVRRNEPGRPGRCGRCPGACRPGPAAGADRHGLAELQPDADLGSFFAICARSTPRTSAS